MEEYQKTEKKLHQFIKKYYKNELIKGGILFLSLGFLYFFFTLFIEHFFWLQPKARTVLFWIFLIVEIYLLIVFIIFPILKLIGIKKGISLMDSSKIIGNHFPTIQDKLLNILQLKEATQQTDLLLASINQKSKQIQPFSFSKAIDFKKNSKYLKYAIFPIFIWLITIFTGNNSLLSDSFQRVINHKISYTPPAPFSFYVVNNNLTVVQGTSFTLEIKTHGNVLPNEVKIIFNNQQYFLQNIGKGLFSYTFHNIQKKIDFQLVSNDVFSKKYTIHIIETPIINNIFLKLYYPRYIRKKNETIQSNSNLVIPEGTAIEWNVQTTQTDTVVFINQQSRTPFQQIKPNNFRYSKRIQSSIEYKITSSNQKLKDYESLAYTINVIKDDFPSINVKSNIDSIYSGTAMFVGQISDDYGIDKLELIYYEKEAPNPYQSLKLKTTKENIQNFFCEFPNNIKLKEGVDYEIFFQVFDNDRVNGIKKTKSRTFSYRKKTTKELEEESLQSQRNTINSLENSIQKQQIEQEELQQIQNELQNKKKINWNDKKKVEGFIKRQHQYQKMMQRQTDKLQENLDEKKEKSETIQNKKEELKQRIEELKKLDKQQKLLDEIQKMADKLKKEDLLKKAKELAQQNKQQERSLERILELTKRFYIEQKTAQIANKLEELSKKQSKVEQKQNLGLESQKEIKKEFNELQKELDELSKDNEKLKEPMELPDTEDEEEEIEEELNKSEENLSNQTPSSAKKHQKKASKKMKQMSAKIKQSMSEMGAETIEENIDDLRKILENLLTFSFQQENLMNTFQNIDVTHPDFGKNLKKQNEIKTYFEHIDDSLYVLSMRLPKISAKIQDHLSYAHYNLDQSLENFSENRFSSGISNQRYVMTESNNLADYLSNVLTNMKKPLSMDMAKGKGKNKGFSLPDLIKKQEGLSKKMKDGLKKGGKEGKSKEEGKKGSKGKKGNKEGKGKQGKNNNRGKGDSNDEMQGELYQIYKEQNQLRQQLQNAIKENGNKNGNSQSKKALKSMEELENEILEKGFNPLTLQKMQKLNYELLKLDKASLEQRKDKKRKSSTNQIEYQKRKSTEIQFKKQFYNQIELLNRQSLPLQQNYKKKVRDYFSEPKLNER